MTKTPEQMAEEFFENWQPEKPKYIRPKARQYALEKVTECFLAGYQAGQEHPFQFQTKMWVEPIGPQNQWISVNERLPEINVDVLIYVNFTVHNITHKYCSVALFDGACWDDDGWYSRNSVTHWMPLPKPPEDK